MPFGIGRFLGRNAGTIGTIAGTVLGGGPMGGMIGGLVGGAIGGVSKASQAEMDPSRFDSTAGTGLGALLTQTTGLVNEQRNRNLLQEAYRGAYAGALGPAAYLESAARQGAGRASQRLALEGAEREAQQISSRALQGQIGLEQQRAQTLLGLTGAQAGLVGQQIQGNQFGMQMAFQEQQALREQKAANLDALLGTASAILTSKEGSDALSNVIQKGNARFKQLGNRVGGFLGIGGPQRLPVESDYTSA